MEENEKTETVGGVDPATVKRLWAERSEALALMGCEGVDADLVPQVRKWVNTVAELRRILGAKDGEDIREVARRVVAA